MQRKSLDVWVGLFIVIGVAALMFLALKAGNNTFSLSKTYEVTAKFDNIGSLRPQASVKASGVVVGAPGSGKTATALRDRRALAVAVATPGPLARPIVA